MGKLVQARIDDRIEEMLKLLCLQGYSESEVLRNGIRLLASSVLPKEFGKEIIGLGKFQSGVKDLGSNKKHLKGFGRE